MVSWDPYDTPETPCRTLLTMSIAGAGKTIIAYETSLPFLYGVLAD